MAVIDELAQANEELAAGAKQAAYPRPVLTNRSYV